MSLQHLRSSTANKRPTPAVMADGQLAMNTETSSPGLFFKNSGGTLVKIGPVHVGTTAPNATPGTGGEAGNSIGEQWLDTSSSRYVFKIWDGSAWRSEDGEFVNASGDTMTGALVMDNQQQVRFRETTVNGTNYIALQAPASVASDKTITLPDVTGTVVTTGDTGSVTSTMLLDGTILNEDINASAAIVDTKLATIATALKVSNSATTATNANTASAIVARDASGNFSAGTITAALTGNASTVTTNANLTGDVTSVGNATSIASGVIVNADVNASAAIAGTKISPDFGSQTVTTTGVVSHALGAAATPTVTFTGDLNTGIYSPGADTLAITTAGTGRLFVNASGSVQAGNPSSTRLEIVAGSVGVGERLHSYTNNYYIWGLRNEANDFAIESAFAGNIVFRAKNDGVASSPGTATERMRITSAGLVGIGDTGPDSTLTIKAASSVTPLRVSGPSSEFCRVDTSGRLLVGTATANGTQVLELKAGGVQWSTGPNTTNGSFDVLNASGTGVYLTSGSTAWAGVSDERFKTNLTEIGAGLNKVGQLRAVTGRYKSDDQSISRSFLIAQDVQNVLPEAVDSNDPDKLGLRYADVIPLLVSALKESKERIETLEQRLTDAGIA